MAAEGLGKTPIDDSVLYSHQIPSRSSFFTMLHCTWITAKQCESALRRLKETLTIYSMVIRTSSLRSIMIGLNSIILGPKLVFEWLTRQEGVIIQNKLP